MYQAVMKLRPAIAADFTTRDGKVKTGVLYFEKSAHGNIQDYPCYLNDDTDLKQFKILFNKCQIFVPINYTEIQILEN